MRVANHAPGAPEIGALLRREGIYSSYLTAPQGHPRHERESGQLQGLSGQKRGRPRDEQAAELARLRQENAHLKAQVAQAAPKGPPIIAAQKNLHKP